MRRLVAAAASALFAASGALAAIPAEVKLDSGTIAGTTGASPDVRVFKGIPFAAPPLGANRWRAPQPVAPWTGVRPATEFAAAVHARRRPRRPERRGPAAHERRLPLPQRLDHRGIPPTRSAP